ncbi:hypothetical protein [Vibrio sp. MEBiC08052]|uniref:hypothetical protein n=1 Tax=Vibrio sp. MEBiC08052 TaxID=1761910 RepID=UPI0007407A25|nr:hypothetical protein [Vibrio sp. MEBiC08052]KUI97725.1 hypothetical protein VRK_32880 [Vibrio sp. MEBiC08052]
MSTGISTATSALNIVHPMNIVYQNTDGIMTLIHSKPAPEKPFIHTQKKAKCNLHLAQSM